MLQRIRGPSYQQKIFARHVRMLLLARVRWGSGLAALLLPLGIFVDFSEFGDEGARIVPARLAISALFGCLYLATRFRGLSKYAGTLSFLLTLTGAAGATMLGFEVGTAMTLYYGSCHLVVLSCALLFPWGPGQMILASVGVFLVFTVPQLWVGNWEHGFITEVYLLVCSSVIATIGALLSHRLRFREFRSRRALQMRTRELRQTSLELQRMDRARTEFYANVSHELRTPLTLILAPVESLLAEGPESLPEKVNKHLGTIHRNSLLLLRLINGILDLHRDEARQAEQKRMPVDLMVLLRQLTEEFQMLAQRSHQTLKLEGPESASLLADPEQIEIIFRNLLANAVKFSADNGRVDIDVFRLDDQLVVDVCDTGPGIGIDDVQRIFIRYERVAGDDVPGSGLGLALVKELVEAHGGTVNVHDTSPAGSIFRVMLPSSLSLSSSGRTLPTGGQELSLLPRPSSNATPESEFRERILVVEDNEELLNFLVDFLSPSFNVFEARTTQEALEQARKEQPSVILSDVMLPGESGVSLIKSLHADPSTAKIPVIFLTALHGLEAKVEGLELGAADYVSKPFVPSELLARIRVQLRLRQLSSDLAQTQKLSMLHTLSAGLAHEIRNPINAITNAVALLRRTVPSSENLTAGVVPELMVVIEESCDRMAALIDDLLSFTDGRSSGTGLWNPVLAVESALRLLHPRLADVRVHQELTFRAELEGNAVRLNQVVLNLLDNALRAVSPEGDVWVRMELQNETFALTVRDSGQGIRPEELARVFDPFFSTRAVNEGLGLGLHICRTIIEAHGGQISVASEWGKGASFTIRLPLEARSSIAA